MQKNWEDWLVPHQRDQSK